MTEQNDQVIHETVAEQKMEVAVGGMISAIGKAGTSFLQRPGVVERAILKNGGGNG